MTREQKIAILADPISRIKLGHIFYQFRIVMDLTRDDLARLTGISVDKLKEFESVPLGEDAPFFAVEDAERLAVVIGDVGDNVEKVTIPRFKDFEEMWKVADKSLPSDPEQIIRNLEKRLRRD